MMTDIVSYDAEDINIPTEWDSSPFKGTKPESNLSKKELKVVEKLSEKIKNGFARTYEDLEICTILPNKIRLNSDEIIHIPPYRRSVLDNEIVEKEFKNS